MVAHDPLRKGVTLDPRNPDDPHVGSNVNTEPKERAVAADPVSGTSSSEFKSESKKSSKKDS